MTVAYMAMCRELRIIDMRSPRITPSATSHSCTGLQSFQVEGPQDREISLFLRIKIGIFLRELFKALPKTIGIRNDLRTVVLWRCLLFILAPRLNRTLSNQAMTMPLVCLTMSARAKRRCRRRLGCFLSTPFICFATLSDIVRKKTITYTTMAYLGKALFLAGFCSQCTD